MTIQKLMILTTVLIEADVGASGCEHANRADMSSKQNEEFSRSSSLHTRLVVGVMLSFDALRPKPEKNKCLHFGHF